MAIKNDLSSLPKADNKKDGRAPDSHPRYLATLADRLESARRSEPELAHSVEGTAFRHSDAGRCARALSYTFAGIARTEQPDASGLWNFAMGHYAHEVFQTALLRAFGEKVEVETTCHLEGFDGSGHADAEIEDDDAGEWLEGPNGLESGFAGAKVTYELKTVGGFAYKMAVGERSAPQGPKWEHIVQGALNATAAHSDLMVIGYLSKEAISAQGAARKKISELGRFMAEWTFLPDEFEPIAAAERARVTGILALNEQGLMAARKIPTPELPAGAEITDPAKGMWEQRNAEGALVDAGSWWACGYCDHRSLCQQLPSGRIPIEMAVNVRTSIEQGEAA